MPYLLINALIHIGITAIWSLFVLRKKLWLKSLKSSTAIIQCHFPPMLSCWRELMSIYILYPGLLGTCFIFFFGMLACLIFACAHISLGCSCPVISIFMYFAVSLSKCSSCVSCDMIEFPHSDLHPWFYHNMCLIYYPLSLNPHQP